MSINNDVIPSDDPAVKEAREKARQSFIELSRQILDLLPTLEDALGRMSGQLEELKLEASAELFQDFGNALQYIDTALPAVFFENEDIDKVAPRLASVFESAISLVGKYEAGEISAIKSCLATGLLPSFKAFRQELETALFKEFPPS